MKFNIVLSLKTNAATSSYLANKPIKPLPTFHNAPWLDLFHITRKDGVDLKPLPVFWSWRSQSDIKIFSPSEVLNFAMNNFSVFLEEEVDFGSSKETFCLKWEEVAFDFDGEMVVRGATTYTSPVLSELDLDFFCFTLSWQEIRLSIPVEGGITTSASVSSSKPFKQ